MSDARTPRPPRPTREDGSHALTQQVLFENLRDLPPEMVPEGMELLWATEEVYGQYNRNGIAARLNQDGYVAMTTAQFPSLKMKQLPGREVQDELIRYQGQVLLGRPKQIGEQQRRQHFDFTRRQLRTAGIAHQKAVRSQGLDVDAGDHVSSRQERARPQFEE